jgi:hypothetical protein
MENKGVFPFSAKKTPYRGFRFRSRLEARWARLFDIIGWAWKYEVDYFTDGRQEYVPDFWLPDRDCFWEVKPDVSAMTDEDHELAQDKAHMLAQITDKDVCISFGFPLRRDYGVRVIVIHSDGSDDGLAWRDLGHDVLAAAAKAWNHRF